MSERVKQKKMKKKKPRAPWTISLTLAELPNVDKYPEDFFLIRFLDNLGQFVKEMYHMVKNKTADLYKIINSK